MKISAGVLITENSFMKYKKREVKRNSRMYHIVICDDDEKFVEYMRKILLEANNNEKKNFKIYEYFSGNDLVFHLDSMVQCDLLILDMQMKGNSFACAHVTYQVICFLQAGITKFDEILEAFKKISKKVYKLNDQIKQIEEKRIPQAGRIAIFPFNKEMHSLVRFSNLLPYSISKIYDSKYTGQVCSTTRYILNDNNVENKKIENIKDIDFDEFDIFVFGHFEELEFYYNKEFRLYLIKELIENDKYIISFDNLNAYKELCDCNKIYYPIIKAEAVPPNRFGKLYRISKPVIGVFGTSSRQGKFTLQLILRERFLKNGYNIGQIGTEPHSFMFGMDCVFPMGYNQAIYIDEWQIVLYLNYQLKLLCDKGKDVILVGSQSGTVVYDTGNLDRYPFLQNAFFQGTNPDAIILVINPYDDEDYIRRTLNYLETGENSKVIAMVVFPMDIDIHWRGMNYKKQKINEQDFQNIILKYSHFQLPIYMLGNETHMDELFDTIIDYFEEVN